MVSLSDLLKQLDVSLETYHQSTEFGPGSYAAELQPFVDCEEHLNSSSVHGDRGDRKVVAPDIIDYLRDGLRRTANSKRHQFPLPVILNNCSSPKATRQLITISEESHALQSPQSARVARQIRKKKNTSIFQKCYRLINNQFGGEMAQTKMSKNSIKFRCFWKTTTIYEVLKARQWVETESELDWDFFWSDVGWMYEFFDHIHLADHQRFNHFRNYYELTRKDFLIKNLKRMKKTLEKEDKLEEAANYNFFPQTYALPAEYGLFVEEFKRIPGVWIMKPVGKARGRGIFLFTRLSQISEWKKDHRWKSENPQVENYIVQKYIESPYLIGGKKFDLRIYVLVLSYAPLKAYLYRSGFARFTNAHFSMKKEDIANKLVHLTNFSIQKHAPTYNSKTGTKWSLHSLKMHMITKHGEAKVNELFHDIRSAILRSLLSVQNVIIQDKHCFELYGYDILVDKALKPWLLEVNASPSLAADTPQDRELKYGMLDDVLTLVDMERRLPTQTSLQVGGFDLLVDQGATESSPKTVPSLFSYLGCYNDRDKQLKQMAKAQLASG
ncbi:tubulin polyglutamylase TTLL9 [Marchantia polymorpha subsp. ruderalis]|uniref:Tubulin--tyrosine ligase-like protein 9 n=1 Tax=Marchantia polymorpha TaxID=3197 RepID=A0A2R6XIU6_MARPO|nr:hypothetical protein MARPO_0012s0012 [Marchantia polymorpha]PTQ46043.1 hypothetical protein MARPO_0012s0012 [Marchantia polymorpha]BBN18385.1 hypothetical protein Mp_8g02150 [Marchantia polymorpha subsp. ruderalis]BBN18387.1 hypothetical protein Mp_8g02150 [Marchantia polymorpha subsp. ruderalis]|eukprot:PTQ46040.1 hypothetical protein MARPO_0012s0012 [Marchantia polymorpha]